LTQRRISDIISELDMLGIINGKVISKGRYGRTRKISLAIQNNTKTKAQELLEKSFSLSK
jgi:archaeal cell division control protein 6